MQQRSCFFRRSALAPQRPPLGNTAEGDQLVEHALGVAHAAFGAPGDGVGGAVGQADFFQFGDMEQVIGDDGVGDAAQQFGARADRRAAVRLIGTRNG